MGIHAEVLRGGDATGSSDRVAANREGRSLLLILHGVDLGVAVTQVESLLTFGRGQAGGVFELMPAPVGHGCQRHTCLIFKRVALQAGNVDRRCKVSVTHGERGQRVGLGNHRVVARDHGQAVDGLHQVVHVVAHLLHLETGPEERAEALGIVITNLL